MGYNETIYTLSNINCGLASINNYSRNRSNGAGRISSALDAASNLCFGIVRNNMAYDMAQNWGSSYGQTINGCYDYGSAEQNTAAIMGIMSGFSPYMYFNCCRSSAPSFAYIDGNYILPGTHRSFNVWHGHLF